MLDRIHIGYHLLIGDVLILKDAPMLRIKQGLNYTPVGVEGLVCQQSNGRIGIAKTKFFFGCLFIALAQSTTNANAQLSDHWSCIGNCDVAIPNGAVSSPPSGNSTYEFITTFEAPSGQGQIQGVGGTNGSNLKLFIPNVNAGCPPSGPMRQKRGFS